LEWWRLEVVLRAATRAAAATAACMSMELLLSIWLLLGLAVSPGSETAPFSACLALVAVAAAAMAADASAAAEKLRCLRLWGSAAPHRRPSRRVKRPIQELRQHYMGCLMDTTGPHCCQRAFDACGGAAQRWAGAVLLCDNACLPPDITHWRVNLLCSSQRHGPTMGRLLSCVDVSQCTCSAATQTHN
jgi:hypothetical protein